MVVNIKTSCYNIVQLILFMGAHPAICWFVFWFMLLASITTIFYFLPNLFPLFSPIKWPIAGNAYFLWQMFFFRIFQ